MPNISIYLNEEEYVKLAAKARKEGLKASQLARKIISKSLAGNG
jgi:hypothetical protein